MLAIDGESGSTHRPFVTAPLWAGSNNLLYAVGQYLRRKRFRQTRDWDGFPKSARIESRSRYETKVFTQLARQRLFGVERAFAQRELRHRPNKGARPSLWRAMWLPWFELTLGHRFLTSFELKPCRFEHFDDLCLEDQRVNRGGFHWNSFRRVTVLAPARLSLTFPR
jgi:hypothetical protein